MKNIKRLLLIITLGLAGAPVLYGMEPENVPLPVSDAEYSSGDEEYSSSDDCPSSESSGENGEKSVQDLIDKGKLPAVSEDGELDLSELKLTSLIGIENIPNPEQITELDLEENRIVDIHEHAFDKLVNLTHLRLVNNPLIQIRPHAFDTLVNLEGLCLEETHIIDLPPHLFDKTRKMKNLHLFENKLKLLPDGLIDQLDDLEDFSIADNQIEYLSPDFFKNNVKLEDLSLFNNKLSQLPTITHLAKLKRLLISGNPKLTELSADTKAFILNQKMHYDTPALLGEIPPYSLSQLIADLGENWMDQLIVEDPDTGALVFDVSNRGLTDLEFKQPIIFDMVNEIKACDNFIRAIPANFFRVFVPGVLETIPRFNEVSTIDLSSNLIEELPVLSLTNDLPNLVTLNCSNNQIKKIGGFKGKRNKLFELNLANNQIQSIPENALNVLHQLQELYLDNNQLQVLPKNVFKNLHALQTLELRHNALGSKEMYVFPPRAEVEFYPQQTPPLKMLAAQQVAQNLEGKSLLEVIATLRKTPQDMHGAIIDAASKNVALKIRNARLVEANLEILIFTYESVQKGIAKPKALEMVISWTLKDFTENTQQAFLVLAPEELRAILIQAGIGENIPGAKSTRKRPIEAMEFARSLEGKNPTEFIRILRQKPADIDDETLFRVASKKVKRMIKKVKRVERALAYISHANEEARLAFVMELQTLPHEIQLAFFELSPEETQQLMIALGFNPEAEPEIAEPEAEDEEEWEG